MFEAGFDGGDEGFKELGFSELAEEAEHGAADEFVGVVEVVSQGIAHQDHLTQEFLGGAVEFGDYLPIQHQELLEQVVVGAAAEADDAHEDARQVLTGEEQHDGLLQRPNLEFDVGVLQVPHDLLLLHRGGLFGVEEDGA